MKKSLITPLTLLFIATALLISWLCPFTSWMWDAVDLKVFNTLNGWIESHPALQLPIAVTLTQSFRFPTAFFMGLFYLYYAFQGEEGSIKSRIKDLAVASLIAGLSLILCKQLIQTVLDIHRASPTATLSHSFRLSEIAPHWRIRDISNNSFPGDNTAVLLIWSGILSRLGGWRYAISTGIFALLFSLPRLVSGAHWLSDDLVGGGVIALGAIALLSFRPKRTQQLITKHSESK